MPLKIASLAKSLLRRFTKPKPTQNTTRFRPMLESCEDRTVPTPVITVAAIADATEGGSAGTVWFTPVGLDRSGRGELQPRWDGDCGFGLLAGWRIDWVAPGSLTTDLSVPVTDDSISEPTETIIFTLTSGTGYTIGSSSSATVNILDNDAQVVSVAQVNDATEGGTAGKFRFTRSGDLSSSLTANFSVSGTATSGTDFTSIGTTVTFAAGSATADVNVAALHDSVDDPDETVDVTVTSGTGYSVGTPRRRNSTLSTFPIFCPLLSTARLRPT